MYSLINKDQMLSSPEKVSPNLNRLIDQHRSNTLKQIAYYATHYVKMDLKNPLIRLCHNLLDLGASSPIDAFNIAKENIDYLSSPIGFTTSVHKGKTHYGAFFGDAPCLILGASETSVASVMGNTTADVLGKAVEVIQVPSMHDSLARPDLAKHEEGFGIIRVDIPLLAFLVTRWSIANMKLPVEQRVGLEVFLGKHILPYSMRSQADAYIMALAANEDPSTIGSSSTQLLSDPGVKLHKEIHSLLKDQADFSHIDQVLKSTPGCFLNTLYEKVLFPKSYVSMASKAVYAGAVLRPLLIGLRVASDNPDRKKVKNDYKREKRMLDNEKIITKLDDDLLRIEMELRLVDIDDLISKY